MAATGEIMMQEQVRLPDLQPAKRSYRDAIPLIIAFAPNWPIVSAIFRIVGTALIISSGAMWLVTGSQFSPDLMLMKLGLSLIFLLSGLAMLMVHHVDNRPDAYFDPIRCEVRVLRKDKRGRPRSVLRRDYDSLGSARFHGRLVEVFDVDGSLLMRLPVDDAETRHALRMQLSGFVNITS
ncbi:hypothetical protein [Jhaorihella thermophila]|uniref:Uncharacterized protein n=1 Tax=Jhaorihella thermophila TaxID=488547 RepID=A0A1H5Y2Y9_9RHOB|nr:hypothetical protein [Jhaorihella thermophila]SEG18212.1 hypothetical protein SAMN05421751_11429 [Jhaorihella thermophila]